MPNYCYLLNYETVEPAAGCSVEAKMSLRVLNDISSLRNIARKIGVKKILCKSLPSPVCISGDVSPNPGSK